nr:YcxB family protein [Mucilaginibacter sp. L294]
MSFKQLFNKNAVLAFYALGLYIIASGVANYIINHDQSDLNGAITSLLVLIFIPVIFYLFVLKRYSKKILDFTNIKWIFSAETIQRNTESFKLTIFWADVYKVSEDKICHYLYLNNKKVLFFKKDDLTEDERQTYLELIILNKIKK